MDPELEAIARDALAEFGAPGVAFGMIANGEVTAGGVGIANVRTGLPFGPASVFPIQSITKTYTAAVLMRLVEQGRIDLDAPVRSYLDSFRVADAAATERVTVRHLLTHTAGWVGDIAAPWPDRGDAALASWVAEEVPKLPQVLPPGQAWSYSNTSYRILGRIIEVARGESYEDALRSMVLEPLGMGDSFLFCEEAVTRPIAVGHQPGEHGAVVCDEWAPPRVEVSEGGLLSTVEDQLRWLRFWLGDGPAGSEAVLSEASRAQMLTPQCDADLTYGQMGLGWPLGRYGDVTVAQHYGSGAGVESQAFFAPGRGFGLVVLINGAGGAQVGRRLVDAAFERHLGVRRTDPATVPAGQDLGAFAGEYLLMALGGAYTIELQPLDGGLYAEVRPPGGPTVMAYPMSFTGTDQVLFTGGPYAGARGDFLRDGAGEVIAARLTGRVCPRRELAPVG
jgi:CubicO group peptidase (beta-lactamase class C family)